MADSSRVFRLVNEKSYAPLDPDQTPNCRDAVSNSGTEKPVREFAY